VRGGEGVVDKIYCGRRINDRGCNQKGKKKIKIAKTAPKNILHDTIQFMKSCKVLHVYLPLIIKIIMITG